MPERPRVSVDGRPIQLWIIAAQIQGWRKGLKHMEVSFSRCQVPNREDPRRKPYA